MSMGALSGLGAVTLALTASAPPLSPAPPPAPAPVVSRAPAHTVSDAIDRAEALGAITAGRADRYRLQWHDAFAAQRKLTGWRRELVVQAGPTLRFEYLFAFGGGAPGWVSAMTQGTGAQALARTSAITGKARYAAAARGAYRALTRPAPRGAAVRGDDGLVAHLAMYSFRPSMRVLNGEEQSLIGIADYARITGDKPAAKLARRGARELATHLGQFDTGAWTLYDLGGAEADLNYHELAARFAKGVCTRALARGFCPAAARFARYTTQPPRLGLAVPAQIRAPRGLTIAMAASKQTSANVIVRDPKGRVVFARSLPLGRFGTRFVVPVRRAGAYSVSLAARAVNGRSARMSRTVIAKPPKPKPKPKRKPKKLAPKKPAKVKKAGPG